MKNRVERLIEIRRLIGTRDIASQEELMKLLEKQGYELTGYIYILPDQDQPVDENMYQGTGPGGLISIDFARGMAILKTLPGHAGSIAYAIDNLNAYEIAGTIAGDDTILLIPRDGVTRVDLVNMMKVRIPGLIREMVN
jgi:transcriptional regulator of arginine metabolism